MGGDDDSCFDDDDDVVALIPAIVRVFGCSVARRCSAPGPTRRT